MTKIPSGIYKITNLKNGKVYVGQSQNVYLRRIQHFVELAHNKHPNKLMQKDYKLYSKYFRFDVIEFCSIVELNEKESYWIEKLNTLEPNGYNQGWAPYKRKHSEQKRKVKGYHKTR